MNRRSFFTLGLFAPFAMKAGLTSAALIMSDDEISVSFAADKAAPDLTLWQTPRQSFSQMMGYLLKTKTGETIVIDGGTSADAKYLVDLIKKHCDGKIDAWFLTHAHSDHCNALCEILEGKTDPVEVKSLYYNFPEQEWLDKNEAGCASETARIFEGLKHYEGARAAKINEVFDFGPVTIKALNDFDPAITRNAINNSSICFRIDVAGKSILILGDLGVEGGERLIKMQGKEVLDCDVVQMAHHGQNGVAKSFYEVATPTICLWPTPDWLWDNQPPGKGPDSGPWKTLQTRAWMNELGVTEHYVSKDGLIKLEF